MSNTPRCANVHWYGVSGTATVEVTFAQQLESELNAVTAERDALRALIEQNNADLLSRCQNTNCVHDPKQPMPCGDCPVQEWTIHIPHALCGKEAS